MRLRALAAGLVLLLLSAVVFTTVAGRGAAPGAARPVPQPSVVPDNPPPLPAMPARNVFEYADDEAPPIALAPQRFRPAPVEVQPQPDVPDAQSAHAVRLVGFVRRAGAVRAALAVRGSIYVLGVGEEAEGYVLLAADEDAGVRIQGPDGVVLTLPPAS